MVISFIMANKKNNKNKEIMKNALGKSDNLKLYNDKGILVYQFYKGSNGFWYESTYDNKGNILTFKRSDDYWYKRTYDDQGNELTFKDSKNYWFEKTYDNKGNILTCKNSNGDWYEYTYDDNCNRLTFKHSDGKSRDFDIPEYTMEELTKIVGEEFKIKK